MAAYGLKAFLIAQSLNQIEKAYGPSNAVLDNCHVRVAFATNDERTAKRISDALGTKTEQRAMKNYAGHRLAPWLSHKMVSRQETARQLLTPGEVMQLPADQELVLVAGSPPVRAMKLRYYEDLNFTERLMESPGFAACIPGARENDWGTEVRSIHEVLMQAADLEPMVRALGLRKRGMPPRSVRRSLCLPGPAGLELRREAHRSQASSMRSCRPTVSNRRPASI